MIINSNKKILKKLLEDIKILTKLKAGEVNTEKLEYIKILINSKLIYFKRENRGTWVA